MAKDIAEALGYSNPSRSVQDHCKYVEILKTTSTVGLEIPARGLQIIPESDVYRLVMRSNLPTAEIFQDWVVEEVLPSIRKTGSYSVQKALPEIQENAGRVTVAARIFGDLKAVAEMLGCDSNAAAISANQACDLVTGVNLMHLLGQTHLIAEKQDMPLTPTELGGLIGLTAVDVNKKLSEAGLQEKKCKKWFPTETGKAFCRVFDTGKKRSGGTPIHQVKWFSSVLDKLTLLEG